MLSGIEKEEIKKTIQNMEIEALRTVVSVIPSTILMEEIYGRLELSEHRLSAIKLAIDSKKQKEIAVM